MVKDLCDIISKHQKLNKEDINLITENFEHITIPRNTILEELGKVPEYLYFISSGFMRLFYYDDNGDEVTTFLSAKNEFVASFLSFIHQVKATENMECITDCDLLRIGHSDMKKLIDTSESFKVFSLSIFEYAISTTNERANDFATLNAEKRYKKLIETKPHLLQNIPIQYIASYLGVKSQSLSRIRANLIK